MIKFRFTIKNPFKFRDVLFKDFGYDKTWTISKNKSFEVQLAQFELQNFFNLDIDLSWNGSDHAGPGISIEILGVYIAAKFYDHRHWDYDNITWEVYDTDH